MKMVDAALIAGVSRQRLTNMKNDFKNGKCPYSFFLYDKENDSWSIDTNNRDWAFYLEKNKNNPNKKKVQEVETVQDVAVPGSDESAAFSALIDSCVSAVKELFNPSARELKDLDDLIKKKFGEMMG